ncbi:uncharacterized protein LOC133815183 [Humulus lupulus]|uniref:uncharacterized protein LOC133815183 n=1 Tax=Humulus lupulus TaxID=3486 RepID=UPI002B403213|nr:uncharacterized protein LOC133815183 [Humulus lupulus]
MPLPTESNDLVDIKQRDNEPLKDYIRCFMQEATKVKSLSDNGKFIAINSGIKIKSPFWSSFKRKFACTTQEFLDWEEEFIKLEEAERKVDNPSQAATGQGKTEVGNTTNITGESKNGAKNGKCGWKANVAESSNNHNDSKKPKTTEQPKPREYVPKFTTYSILMESPTDVFKATQTVVPCRRPPPMRKDVNRRDMTKLCWFHNDYSHETNECNHLKEEIEILIRQNNAHLKSKSREKYALSLRYEKDDDVLVIQEHTPKQPHYECEPIIFNAEDTGHVHHPHNDPLVVEVQIANMIVARKMIDLRSSTNILFKNTLERMNFNIKDLEPCEQLLYGFTGSSIAIVGSIRLPLMVGAAPKGNTVMDLFVVIDIPSPYNAMIGRPALYDL